MNLASGYLGLPLRSPFVVGACPLCDDVQMAGRLEEAGAGAIVLRSLFEEQMRAPWETGAGEAPVAYQHSPDSYLRHIATLKRQVTIPVIASLNGHRPGAWMDFAPRLQDAGADAIELNFYQLVADPAIDADRVETDMLETVGDVVGGVELPVAVKLSPYHASVAQLAIAMELAGASGIVVFNRFLQPDVDVDQVRERVQMALSEPGELLLRLRWLAILAPLVRGSLAASGGVYTGEDVVKAILSGAHAVQLVSLLMRDGPAALGTLRRGIERWMRKRGFENLDEFRGKLALPAENAAASERANYIRMLQSWKEDP